MQKLWNHYHSPTTIEEAAALLQQYAGNARIIGGGTDLLVERRDHQPQEAFIDISCIPEMTAITQQGDHAIIGGGVTHAKIVKSEVVAARATCLVESCGVVGGPQVRNVATLGGNVVHALPAGDGTTSLVALNAEAEIFYNGTRQWVPILDMYKGAGVSLIDPTRDILLNFRIKLAAKHEASAFKRIMRPQGVALPVLGCAVWVRLTEDGSRYDAARICLAPIGATPGRAAEVEAALLSQPADEDTLETAVQVALETLHPRTSKYRATGEYRQEMIAVLLRRTLPLAVHRARTGEAIPEGVGQ